MNKKLQKNLVIIKADELRFDALSCAGNSMVKTPNIDRLAEHGVNFNNAFCVSPLCVPSRVSFFTGQYVNTHKGISNGQKDHIGLDQTALPQLMKEAGYATALCGKNHAFQHAYCDRWFDIREEYTHWGKIHGEIRINDEKVSEYRHNDQRPEFSNFGPAGGYPLLGEGLIEGAEPFDEKECMTWRIAEDSVKFVSEHRDEPFFLHMSFPDPHWPNTVCEPYYSMIAPESIPDLEAFPMDWTGHPFKHFVQSQACGYDHYTEAERKRILATCYGQIMFIDKAVGMLLDELDAQGLTDNTLIIFTSDHGDFNGCYGLIGKTGGFMDTLLRIPLIISGPDIPAGKKSSAMLSNIDVLPSIMELMGMKIPESVQGRSVLPSIKDQKITHRKAVFAEVGSSVVPPPPIPIEEYASYNRMRTEKDGWFWFVEYASNGRSAAIRTENWKYTYYVGDCDELYDLNNDVYEEINLATNPIHDNIKQKLRNQLFDWMLNAPFGVEPDVLLDEIEK
jgi:arylsulfatase